MPRWLVALIALVSTVLVLVTVSLLRHPKGVLPPPPEPGTATVETQARGVKKLIPRPGLENLALPEFSLINQSGEAVDQSLFDGHVTVLAFIFTNCQLACPPMTANMFLAYNALEGTPVRFVSISVDPLHDTPEKLTAYAANLSIDTKRWCFLTGPEGSTRDLVAKTLDFDISLDPDETNVITLGDGSKMQNIRHPTKLFLVGPDRQILDFCAPTVGDDLQRFIALARKAAA